MTIIRSIHMKVLITGGAGFIGSHAAEYFSKKKCDVTCYDNLSRAKLLKKDINSSYNWQFLKKFSNVKLIEADIRNLEKLKLAAHDADLIIHTAAQTAVTTSVDDPRTDFETNALGTFNVMESARLATTNPVIIYCSTNKVYGANVDKLDIAELETRYILKKTTGVSETFSVDLSEHTPYGCSKLAGDLYAQDYSYLYGLRTGVFRMSCIYGTRQLGVEDQGWLAWFAIATLLGKPITIYGNGKQVRDVLYVDDLVKAYDAFYKSNLKHGVFNTGGGPDNTLSLLELLDLLESLTGRRTSIKFSDWRPSDQKVYISDITKIKQLLNWKPETTVKEGVGSLVQWVRDNNSVLS